MQLGRRPIHPLLVAAYPILFLFGENLSEVSTDEIWLPLLAALVAAGVASIVLTASLRDANRAAVLVTAVLVAFFGFGHAKEALGPLGINPGPLLIVTGVLLLAVVGLVVIGRGDWEGVTRAANVGSAILVGLALVTIGTGGLGASAAGPPGRPDPSGGSRTTDRDIYYIVLDRYGSEHVVRTYFDVADPLLYRRLPELGFTVVPDSQTNYPRTIHSLASSLNLEYLDDVASAQGRSQVSTRPLVEMLQDHAVGRFLKGKGYAYVHLGSWWDATESNRMADVNPRFGSGSDFLATLNETTIMPELLGRLRRLGLPVGAGPVDNYRRHYEAGRFDLAQLPELAALAGPKFVFAHILLPHDPYVFDADGSFVTPEVRRARTLEESFGRQLAYTDEQIFAFLQSLVDVPADEQPIVVLQSDEGPQPRRYDADEGGFRWDLATPDELDMKFGILNAFFLPGDEAPVPYAGISPVNAFRLVLGSYFGADLPLLPDRHIVFRDRDHPYDLIDMTGVIRRARAEAGGG